MPNAALLEAFETPSAVPFVIEHVSDEFTSVCPKTGHPDFGSITLRYQPAPANSAHAQQGCVELKSLKLYYQSFRSEGIYYEAVSNRLREDLVAMLRPTWLQIITNWKGRGGISSVIRADFGDIPAHFRGR